MPSPPDQYYFRQITLLSERVDALESLVRLEMSRRRVSRLRRFFRKLKSFSF